MSFSSSTRYFYRLPEEVALMGNVEPGSEKIDVGIQRGDAVKQGERGKM